MVIYISIKFQEEMLYCLLHNDSTGDWFYFTYKTYNELILNDAVNKVAPSWPVPLKCCSHINTSVIKVHITVTSTGVKYTTCSPHHTVNLTCSELWKPLALVLLAWQTEAVTWSGGRSRLFAAGTFGRQVWAEPEATCRRLVNRDVV